MDDSPLDRAVERRLRELRPAPDPTWQLRLREDVIDPATRRVRPRLPALRIKLVAAGASVTTLAFVAAGVLGGGPLGSLSDEPVSATDGCHFETVLKRRKTPRLVQTNDGARIEYRVRTEPVRVKRCG